LTTKNHFGSHSRGNAEHLHPGLIAPENDIPMRMEYGLYRVLTDVMGHEKLGGNTVLFVVDGLWGGTEAVDKPVKWDMAPFNGDWPNSIIASQDQVALESVCFDFLRTEFDDPAGPGKGRPLMGAVDDHLHQAASSDNWPEGFTYDPEGDGTPLGSLGVHEHWNNPTDKKYSRNLGYDQGIELVGPDATGWQLEEVPAGYLTCYPNPFIDMLHADIDLRGDYTGPVTFNVYGLDGRVVLSLETGHLAGGTGTLSADLGGLPAGTYLLEVRAGELRLTETVIKQ